MTFSSMLFLGLGFIVAGLAGFTYLIWTPIPSGFSKPWLVHVAYSSVRLSQILGSIAERVGLGPPHEHTRVLFTGLGRLKALLDQKQDLKVVDTTFDGVPVRVYSPNNKFSSSAGFVHYHGGGWTLGSIDAYDNFTRRLARKINAVVVSVEYRLAPEHIFPAAFDDCLKATKCFLKNASNFGVDGTRVAIGGDSAGGNLAAAVAIKLRDECFTPVVKLQVLLYPSVQSFDFLTPSYQQNANDTIIGKKDVITYWPFYAQGHNKNGRAIGQNFHTTPAVKKQMAPILDINKLPKEWTATGFVLPSNEFGDEALFREVEHILMSSDCCPLIAKDLSSLPKAYIFTGQNDVLRDEGFWYAQRLREAGVQVHHRHSDIAFHGIFLYHDMIPEASEYTKEMISYVRNNL